MSKDGSDKTQSEDNFAMLLSPFTSRKSPDPRHKKSMTSRELMTSRWLTELKAKIPAFDVEDAHIQLTVTEDKRRQTAPEYSQSSYLYMMSREKSVGNYFQDECQKLKIEPADRESMVSLIQELHRVKEYSEETFYQATAVADRYLAKLAAKGLPAPNLI